MKIIKKYIYIHSPEPNFIIRNAIWSAAQRLERLERDLKRHWSKSSGREEISTGIGADSSGREEISRPPLVDSYTLSSFYNKITIFPLIVMYFSSRFLSVFGFLIYIIVSCFQTYYINSIFPLNKYQLYSYKFLRASIS